MTWKQFKEFVEKAGVTDDMPIFYIDVHMPDADGSGMDVQLPSRGDGFAISTMF